MLGLVLSSLVLSLFCCSVFGINDPSLPVGLFYPFGPDQGDSVVPIGRFNYSEVQLSKAVAFDTSFYAKLNVETHGLLAFGHRYEGDTPASFPIVGDTFCAPYWAGADTALNNGRVYFRETADSQLLERATQEFRADIGQTDQLYAFSPQTLFIATWHNITFNKYGNSSTPVNSFQAILAWNRKQTAVSYRYGKLTWTTGGYSGGNIDGTAGSAATMGFNSGNNGFYYTHEWSASSNILLLVNNSNVGLVGRYSYRIDRLSNVTDCFENVADAEDLCPLPYQKYNDIEGVCYDFAPPFGCPVLTGPVEKLAGILNQKKFEFNCAIVNGSNDPSAVYDVSFYFDGQVDCTVPSGCPKRVSITTGAILSSNDLRGKNKMGKWIGCKVRSYWEGIEDQKSNNLTSNEYYMGLEFSTRSIVVREDEVLPATLVVKSTVPITCFDNSTSTCSLKLEYNVINENAGQSNVAFRQRFPGVRPNPIGNGCEFVIKQEDWKGEEQRAYNVGSPLEVLAKLDPYTTGARTAWLTFRFAKPGSEQSIWFGFESPIIQLYHVDVAEPMVACIVNADPHFRTYDGVTYSTHCHGKYYYAVNTPGGLGFEVQARHCPCAGPTGNLKISCVCGIALREDRLIFVADTCYKSRQIQYASKENNFQYLCESDNGCGMFVNSQTFKLVTPSGNRVYGVVYGNPPSYAYINVQVLVTARFKNVTGLCGSPDGNRKNDWIFANNGTSLTIPAISDPWPPKILVDGWGRKANESLFEFQVNLDLPDVKDADDRRLLINYCQCTRNRNTGQTDQTCGGSAITQQQWPGDPVNVLTAPAPKDLPNDTYCLNFQQNDNCRAQTARRKRSASWPTQLGITEEEANNTCWSRIINPDVIGKTCFDIMMNDTETAQNMVDQCVVDVQATQDLSWAADKINSVQRICYLQLITGNYSDSNDTADVIDLVVSSLQEVTAYMCVPIDCNGHGSCINGTCLCEIDYVGSDCGVSRSAKPVIQDVLSKDILDVRVDSTGGVSLSASDVANTPDMTCKFETNMRNGVSKTYTNSGIVTSPSTVVCRIPDEPMNYNSKGLDFKEIHPPGFNFSCLPAGSPVVGYTLSISNDGQTFSNTVELKLFDSICVDCDDVACTRVPDTCEVNGYCFADQDANPYMEGCEICDITVSQNAWTPASAGNNSCPNVTKCAMDEVCVPGLDLNNDCRLTTSVETTTRYVNTGVSQSTIATVSSPLSSVVNTDTTSAVNTATTGTTIPITPLTAKNNSPRTRHTMKVQSAALLLAIIAVYYT